MTRKLNSKPMTPIVIRLNAKPKIKLLREVRMLLKTLKLQMLNPLAAILIKTKWLAKKVS